MSRLSGFRLAGLRLAGLRLAGLRLAGFLLAGFLLVLALVCTGGSLAGDIGFQEARRLTWDRSTRQEGIAALRSLAATATAGPEVRATLGEVLTWDQETRPEGIRLLEEVLAENPGRNGTRLILAEVLSWDSGRRDEAETLYQEALARDPGSGAAQVGLARLTSWNGELARAEGQYQEVLSRDAENPEARLGLAEVQRWSGRARVALRTLEKLPPRDRDSAAARRQRAAAWLALDRPGRARDEYQALLAADPEDQEARQAMTTLQRDQAPFLEFGVEGNTESGDPATSKVRFLQAPVLFNWGRRDWRYRAGGDLGFYENSSGSTRRTGIGGGLVGPLGRRVRLSAEGKLNDFQDDGTEWTGLLDVRIAASDRVEIITGGRRRLLDDSRLTLGGQTIDGVHYGPVLENAFFAGLAWRPGRGWDLTARGLSGSSAGESIRDNDRLATYAGFGRTVQVGRAHLRPGYSFTWMSYDLDLSGFPPQDLGGNGVTSPGVGGYFSPSQYVNHMARLDASWNGREGARYSLGGGLGVQRVNDTYTSGYGDWTASSDFYAVARWRLTRNWDLRGRASYENIAQAFNRTRLAVYGIRRF